MRLWKKIIVFVIVVTNAIFLSGCNAEPPASLQPANTTMQTETISTTEPTEPSIQPQTEPETEPEKTEYILSLVGDCTLGTNPPIYNAQIGFIRTIGEDYGRPFRNVQQFVSNDDLTLANLEGPLVDGGVPVANRKFNFHGPTVYVNILLEGSVEFVSLANNHTEDYGKTGYESTIRVLDEAGISYVERDSSRIVTLEDGTTVGIYAAVFYLLDADAISKGIADLKEAGADFIIFAPHWGTENSYSPTEQQITIAHAAIDAGADIVWGHHPHVLQPVEKYGEGLIFYSLGNFSFGGNSAPKDFDSALVQLHLARSSDGFVELDTVDIHPVCISSVSGVNDYTPTLYETDSEEYVRVLEKLNWPIE